LRTAHFWKLIRSAVRIKGWVLEDENKSKASPQIHTFSLYNLRINLENLGICDFRSGTPIINLRICDSGISPRICEFFCYQALCVCVSCWKVESEGDVGAVVCLCMYENEILSLTNGVLAYQNGVKKERLLYINLPKLSA
jgi:hypothetical protein